MHTGAITDHIDVAQVVLYAFWLFFAGLIFYLRREDRREGYPLRSEPSGKPETPGFVAIPDPKVFRLFHGGIETAPRPDRDTRKLNAVPVDWYGGSPIKPVGDPMLAGVGPGAWVERADTPDLTVEGLTRIAPLRIANDFAIAKEDPDPRGMSVIGADGLVGGTVRDVWVDRSETIIRYLEVEVTGPGGAAKRVLLPMTFAQIDGRRNRVKVVSILSTQFANVPALSNPERITLREEDKVTAYYGGGILYAEPSRQEPLI
jgi:photosynthetic reaction center H subunit